MKKEQWVGVYIGAGFVFVLAGIASDNWTMRLTYGLIGMCTLLAGVLHSHAAASRERKSGHERNEH